MKRITSIMLSLCIILLGTQCSEDENVKPEQRKVQKSFNLPFKYTDIDGIEKTVTATFEFNEVLQRYTEVSGLLVEMTALEEVSKKVIYVYSLKSVNISSNNLRTAGDPSIKKGYYGYDAGCFYWGTLITANNGDTYFIQSSSNFNPPICPGGQWARGGKQPVDTGEPDFMPSKKYNRAMFEPLL